MRRHAYFPPFYRREIWDFDELSNLIKSQWFVRGQCLVRIGVFFHLLGALGCCKNMSERGYCPGPRSKGWRVDREEDGLVGVQASSLKDWRGREEGGVWLGQPDRMIRGDSIPGEGEGQIQWTEIRVCWIQTCLWDLEWRYSGRMFRRSDSLHAAPESGMRRHGLH